MKILVVGGAGYVGGAVTDLLIEKARGFVTVFDSLLYEESYRKNVKFVYGDIIKDRMKLRELLHESDVVIWLAALVGDGACALNPDLAIEVNQTSVEWLAENFDGRIIFMSTASVYGIQNSIITEDSFTNPLSVYAETKLVAEGYLAKKNAIIFRLGTLFGVGDQFSRIRLDLILNNLVAKAATTGRITIFGGNQHRPLLHVKDAAIMVVREIESKATGIYNLCKMNITINDLANIVCNNFQDIVREKVAMSFHDTRDYQISSTKARFQLGFEPTYSLSDGIEDIREIIEGKRIVDSNNPRYTNQAFLQLNSRR